MSALETRTFRADNLEQALGDVRNLLGPEAIVLRQREGIVGGIGGFFGKRCVEVDVELPVDDGAPKPIAMPARAVTNAYFSSESLRAVEADEDDPGDLFRDLLDESSVFASTLADALDEPVDVAPEPESIRFDFEPIAAMPVIPEPSLPEPPPPIAASAPSAELVPASAVGSMSLTVALTSAGIDLRLAESIVSDADSQLRVFDPTEPFANQVREMLAARIPTRRLGGRFRRRVIALVGAPGSGKTSAAARLCEAHVASGRRVVALSLEPVRRTLELGRQTEALDIELITADHPALIDFALTRLARAETVIVDTPGIAAGDEAGWARLAMLLGPIAPHETHLLLPGTLDAAGIDAGLGSASEKLRIDRLMLTHLEGPMGSGPAVSAAIRAGIPISATASPFRVVPADPYRLAARILP
ncbi:MAG TPA: AAA family ATPase [Gaiellaceae bacterium]|jgi:flagellar biosynthesis GTPase FlhF|nr:AAA family ATPase [Gaiellaceae bacterium]